MFEQLLQNLSPQEVIVIALAAISLVLDHAPVVKEKFDNTSVYVKRMTTLTVAVLLSAFFFAGQCFGWFATNLVCSSYTILDFFYAIVIGVAVMYGFHNGTKPTSK